MSVLVCYDFLQACIKPQYVDQIPKAVKGTVQGMLDKKDELHVQDEICSQFGKIKPANTNVSFVFDVNLDQSSFVQIY